MARASSRNRPRKSREPRQEPALFELRVHLSRTAEPLAEEVGGWLVASGAGGIVEEEGPRGRSVIVTYGERDALLALASELRPLSETLGKTVRVEVRPARAVAGWETAFLEHLEPVTLGPSLTLVPLRPDGTVPPGELPPAKACIFLEPAVAFGFGEHPTTRMAAREVERFFTKRRGASLLDVGTGSGVLAIVAARVGASRAVGVDIDARAVDAATQNAARNDVAAVCRFSKTPVVRVTGTYDLVVANVDRNTLLRLAAPIGKRVGTGGTLILTGVLPEDGRDLDAAYGAVGFKRRARKLEGAFALFSFTRAVRRDGPAAAKARSGKAPTKRKTSRKPRSR